MIHTLIRYLRIGFVIVGFLLLIGSVFLPYYSVCEVFLGYQLKVYWIQLLLTVAAFVSGYFYSDIVNKALLYTFSAILLVFLAFFWLAPNWASCAKAAEIGGNLSRLGSCFVILGTFIAVYREAE